MAEKSLWFRMFGQDNVTPVFQRVGAEAELTGAKVRASFAEAGAMIGGPIGKGTAEANKGFKTMGASSLMTAAVVAGAVGAIAVHTTKMAADFQSSIVKLQTTAGESAKNLDVVSKGILSMAGVVGYSAQQLADGMYTVESAGFHGAEGLNVMKAAAQGARIEGADLTTVTDAVTSAMVDFHLHGALGAAQATNTLIQAVGHGKTTMEGMAAAFPNVAAAAAGVGVSMQETAAAIATMTQHGTDAAKAGTYLRQMLGQLASGGSKNAQAAMESVGLSASALSRELGTRGLAATIQTLQGAIDSRLTPAARRALQEFEHSKTPLASYQKLMDSSGHSTQNAFGAMTKMVGGVKSLQGILQLGGENLKTFKSNFEAISTSVRKSGTSIDGLDEYSKTLNAHLNQLKGAMSALGVGIGTDLIPAMTTFTSLLQKAASFLVQHQTAVEILGAALGTLAVGFIALTAVTWAWNAALAANPVGLVIIGIAALAAGLVVAYNKSATFRAIVTGALNAVKTAAEAVGHFFTGPFVSFFTGAWDKIKSAATAVGNWLKDHWKGIIVGIAAVIAGPLGAVVALIATHWSQVKAGASAAWNAIKSTVSSAWGRIESAVRTGAGVVVSFMHGLPGRIVSAIGNLGRLLWSAGADLIHGLIGGIQSMIGSAVSTAKSLASSVGNAFKGALGIHSPSRVFHGYGENIVEGLGNGINSKKSWIADVFGGWANLVKEQGSKLTGSGPGIPSTIFDAFGQSIVLGLGQGTKKQRGWFHSVASDVMDIIRRAGSKIATDGSMQGYGSGVMDQLIAGINGKRGALQAAMTSATKLASDAASKLKSDLSAQASFESSFTSSFAPSNVFGATDATTGDALDVTGMIALAQQQRDQARQLQSDVKRLTAEGISKALLQQLSAAGTSGMAQIHSLAAGPAGNVKTLSTLTTQTTAALGGAAKTAGTDIFGVQIAADRDRAKTADKIAKAVKDAIAAEKMGTTIAAHAKQAIRAGIAEEKVGAQVRKGAEDGVQAMHRDLQEIKAAIAAQARETQKLERQGASKGGGK